MLWHNEYESFKSLSVDWREGWKEIRLFIDENLKQSFRECHSETDDTMVTSLIFLSLSTEINIRVSCLHCERGIELETEDLSARFELYRISYS